MDSNNIDVISSIFVTSYLIIFLLGIVGNIMCFIVNSRREFKKYSFSIYSKSLALSDTIQLLFAFNDYFRLSKLFVIPIRSFFLCKSFFYVSYIFGPISFWTQAAISLDRLVSITRPRNFLFRNKKWFQYLVTIFIWFYNPIYYIYAYINVKFDAEFAANITESSPIEYIVYACFFDDPDGIIYWMDFLNAALIPFFIMLVSNIVIIYRIYESRKLVRQSLINQTNNRNIISHKDKRFAITSLSLNFLFFIFNFPVTLIFLLMSYLNIDLDRFLFIYKIVMFFYYLNFGTLFIVNICFNALFRKEFFKLLRLHQNI